MCSKPKAPKAAAPAKDPLWKSAKPTDTANRGTATPMTETRRIGATDAGGTLGGTADQANPTKSVLGG